MNQRWLKWAAAAGAVTCAVSAALSVADAIGATPAPFFLRGRFWFSSMRAGGVPVEFFGMLWFLAVFALSRARATQPKTAAIAVCASAAGVTGFALWYLVTRSASCGPLYAVSAAAGTVLAASAFDADAWPDSLLHALRDDLRALAGSRWARTALVGFVALAAMAGSALHVLASGVTKEQAFERDLRRWYLQQRPAEPLAQLPARAGGVTVTEFTDYLSTAARNVAPQRAAQLAEFERHGLPVALVSKHVPSETECNPRYTGTPHAGACDAAYAVTLALLVRGPREAQALAAWLYSRAPALSPALIRTRLSDLGLLDAFVNRRAELRQAVLADVDLAGRLGITAAPAYFVNGVRMPDGRGMLVRLLRFERERRGLPPDSHPAPAPAGGGITGAIAPPATIRIDEAPSLGDPAARLVLVEFADFQCSFCAAFARTSLPALKKTYIDSGRMRFVFMHLPLPPLHAAALPAAEIAECARRQDRFWPLHDLLFERQDRIDAGSLRGFALEAGSDPARLDRCVAGEASAAVAEDTAAAYALDIRGTPAFFLGYDEGGALRVVRRLQGAKPLAEFTAAIDALLAGETQ